jgi:hypothetical protein
VGVQGGGQFAQTAAGAARLERAVGDADFEAIDAYLRTLGPARRG